MRKLFLTRFTELNLHYLYQTKPIYLLNFNSNVFFQKVSDDHEAESLQPPKKKKRGKKKGFEKKGNNVPTPPWLKKDFTPEPSHLMEPSYPKKGVLPQFEYVNIYINEEILHLIVDKSNQTHVLVTGKSLNLTVPQLKAWLGCNFVMAALPKIRILKFVCIGKQNGEYPL